MHIAVLFIITIKLATAVSSCSVTIELLTYVSVICMNELQLLFAMERVFYVIVRGLKLG